MWKLEAAALFHHMVRQLAGEPAGSASNWPTAARVTRLLMRPVRWSQGGEFRKIPEEPGMLMKKQTLSEKGGLLLASARNQTIENNGVAKAHPRLGISRKQRTKMKG